MHLPRPSSDLFMLRASLSRDASSLDLERETFSEPARSIRLSSAVRGAEWKNSFSYSRIWTTACERDYSLFIAVCATARLVAPTASAALTSSGPRTVILVSDST